MGFDRSIYPVAASTVIDNRSAVETEGFLVEPLS
ncbi:MAG: hypothetical protein Metus_1228 [Candidatus Methanosuratincola subterraneus]|jgi:hypothetical protein|uniref:Uncharacterized protein n=1 Tax=Methanosuratincola subterraneus TaxID=2593994 RepID=A0A444L6R1_METS7|nr:MAG: hypothetical protein Metus_1228 [Candidatus Methanosuratincola subterraneus]